MPTLLPRVTVALSVRGRAAPDDVWERYAVPARWPSWSPQVRAVASSTPRLRAGTSGRVSGPWPLELPYVVTAVDETARTWSWRVGRGPAVLQLDHGVERDGDGTRTWLRVAGPVPLVLGYVPFARIALGRLVR